MLVGTVGVHDKDLVTFIGFTRRHKNETATVVAEVSFGVLSPEGQLLHVAEMFFLGIA
jgi:hypothetical protein